MGLKIYPTLSVETKKNRKPSAKLARNNRESSAKKVKNLREKDNSKALISNTIMLLYNDKIFSHTSFFEVYTF